MADARDLSRGPPSRWRVVERDRRLVVIDTGAQPAEAEARAAFSTTAFDGRAQLQTSRWYDANGPRSIALDPGSAQLVKGARIGAVALLAPLLVLAIWFPIVLLPALFVAVRVTPGLRTRITAWLDRIASEAG